MVVPRVVQVSKIYQHDKYNIGEFESKKDFNFQQFSFYEQLKFHAQLSWLYQFLASRL